MITSSKAAVPTILVVDDDADVRDYVQKLLEGVGFDVAAAGLGIEAVLLAKNISFDTIFMDINLPDITGFNATRLIRFEESKQSRPPAYVVAHTSDASQSCRDEARAAGMDFYLTKSASSQELINTAVPKLAMGIDRAMSSPPFEQTRLCECDFPDEEELSVRKTMQHLIPRYLIRVQQIAGQIEYLFEEKELDAIFTIGHNLKGSGSIYGFKKLSAIGGAIELATRSSDFATLQKYISELAKWISDQNSTFLPDTVSERS